MLVRRVYSSLARSTALSEPPRPPTRGRVRVKPRSNSTSQAKATATRIPRPAPTPAPAIALGHGRRRRSGLRSSRSASDTQPGQYMVVDVSLRNRTMDGKGDIPFVKGTAVKGFEPVHLYPVQAALHMTFNPPHLPLPVHLGTKHYLTAKQSSPSSSLDSSPPSSLDNSTASTSTSTSTNSADPFALPPRKSPVSRLMKKNDNALGDHHTVLSALSLSPSSGSNRPFWDAEEGDQVLSRMIAEAGVKWRLSSEQEWENTLATLSGKANSSTAPSISTTATTSITAPAPASVADAVTGLESLLEKLEMDEDKMVQMDSVRRKRQKKISKHKYKKRRKAQRAQRKRLGK